MGLDLRKEIAKAIKEVEEYNQEAQRHNAIIQEKIDKLKKAQEKLLDLQTSVSNIKTDNIKKAGDNVWKGVVNRKYHRVTNDVDDDIKKFSQAIQDAINQCGTELINLSTQFKPTLPLPSL